MAEEKKASETPFCLFDRIAPVVPTFLSDVAACLNLKEQVQIFQLVCKDFMKALPRFLPLMHDQKPALSPLMEALKAANNRGWRRTREFIWDAMEGDELRFREPYRDCTMRLLSLPEDKISVLAYRWSAPRSTAWSS
mmetsp:Transcript_18994/g.71873  ORF Transcript_18994/g.71873 Transcript_18994/m.71873 type:complete len:137 (+) Transcript_18994:133-543(+)|eukprot:scaffold1682_cov159-Pinguiococcus_pyrenoidosus.AAC.4